MLETEKQLLHTAIKIGLTYRFNMLLQIIIGPLYIAFSYILWKSIFTTSNLETIGGFTFQTMIIYIVITQLINNVVYDDIQHWMAQDISSGLMVTYLLRPITYFRFHIYFKIGNRLIALLIQAIPVGIIMGFIFGFKIYLTSNLFMFFISVIIAFIISFLIRYFIGIFAFWFTRVHGIIWMYNMLHWILVGSFLPLSLYPQILQKISFFLPFQYASYIPAQIFLGTTEFVGHTITPITLIGIGCIQIVILYLACVIFWYYSVKKFCGVGT